MMDVIYVLSMFHKEIVTKDNNVWRDQGRVLCNKLTAVFFVNVDLPLLFSILKAWAFTSLALTSFFGLILDCSIACMCGGRL